MVGMSPDRGELGRERPQYNTVWNTQAPPQSRMRIAWKPREAGEDALERLLLTPNLWCE